MGKNRSHHSNNDTPFQLWIFVPAFLVTLALGFLVGWFAGGSGGKAGDVDNKISALRLNGYKFISPLLACDRDDEETSESVDRLKNKVSELISKAEADKRLDDASVYFRDYNRGESMTINSDEKYYPASLSKIPVMIALYKMAETDPGILDKRTVWDDQTDYNATQEIKPKDWLKVGSSYSNAEAAEMMIKYSDNNAFYFLTKQVSPKVYETTFSDLKIPLRKNENEPADYLTAKDFSYFLRVLYNSTYLKREYSEKALELLNSVDFRDGLAKNIPQGVQISHKYGLKSNFDGTTPSTSNELHDCGIVYDKQSPYLLCVMTKSSAILPKAEETIAAISDLVYKTVDKNYQE